MKRTSQLFAALMLLSVTTFAQAQAQAPQPASRPISVTKVVPKAPVVASQPAKAPVLLKAELPTAPTSQPVVKSDTGTGVGVGGVILNWVLQLVSLAVLALLGVLVRVLGKKFHLEAQADAINNVLAQAIGYAEQMAAKKLKVDGQPTPSGEKMRMAIDFANKMAVELGLDKKAVEWWEAKLEGWLGCQKVPE
jgi:hypothetical protein